jgi:RimJ/RimL family protein N-acetyltransferase
MSYYEKLKEIKNFGSVDFMKIKYQGKNVILRLVDESDETVILLTKWREMYRNNFGTDFSISEKKTREWLRKGVLENPDKIVFVIYVENRKIGIISTAEYDEKTNSAILDTMMKDPTYKLPGLMTTIEKVYLKWMFDELNLSKITGFLFSDNKKMMGIHQKCGWAIIDIVPIQKISTDEGTKWEKISSKLDNMKAERYFNLIELTRENLMKHFDNIEYQILV